MGVFHHDTIFDNPAEQMQGIMFGSDNLLIW